MAGKPESQTQLIVNFEEHSEKWRFFAFLGTLSGKFRITIERVVKGRTRPQNSWYHVEIVEKCRVGLAKKWARAVSHDEAHNVLKGKFLFMEIRYEDKETGEVLVVPWVRSTTALTTVEFSEYCDECIEWIREELREICHSPDEYFAAIAAGENP